MKTKALLERVESLRSDQQQLYTDAETLVNTATAEKRSLTDDESKRFEGFQNDIEKLEDEISRTEWLIKGFDKHDGRSTADQEGERQQQRNRKSWAGTDGASESEYLTRAELHEAIIGWMFRDDATPKQRQLASQAGMEIGLKQIELLMHRGYDPGGTPLRYPQSMAEWERQCRYRAEQPIEAREELVRNKRRRAVEARDQSAGTDTAGGYLVPDDMMAMLD